MKSKKNADSFEYFFSAEDINERYKDFLNPEPEPAKLTLDTHFIGKTVSIGRELEKEYSLLKVPWVDANKPKSSNLDLTFPQENEEFEAAPPLKHNDSPVPSFGSIPQPSISIETVIEKLQDSSNPSQENKE